MKALKMVGLACVVMVLLGTPLLAATPDAAAKAAPVWTLYLGAGLGAALSIIGAAYGISRIASAAVESIARQPEAAGDVRGTMIIAAALIEGVCFLALIICLLMGLKG